MYRLTIFVALISVLICTCSTASAESFVDKLVYGGAPLLEEDFDDDEIDEEDEEE